MSAPAAAQREMMAKGIWECAKCGWRPPSTPIEPIPREGRILIAVVIFLIIALITNCGITT
jgi:ribosomal protein L37AE/L43A